MEAPLATPDGLDEERLDDVVRELLKPMLKEWLDENLPQLVEAEVAKEIDRIRRMSR